MPTSPPRPSAGRRTPRQSAFATVKALTTDGPFAETKEVLGGFYILDCRDLDEALEYAAKIPDAINGAVEVRPVYDVPGWDYATPGERRPMG